MNEPISSGIRIGEKFVWIDIDRLQLRENDKAVLLTVRKATFAGDVINREIATWEHVHALRRAAAEIEKALQKAAGETPSEKAA